MEHITLTDEELTAVAHAQDPIAVLDSHGKIRGYIAMVVGCDELADAKRSLASKESCYTTEQVIAKLHAQRAP